MNPTKQEKIESILANWTYCEQQYMDVIVNSVRKKLKAKPTKEITEIYERWGIK